MPAAVGTSKPAPVLVAVRPVPRSGPDAHSTRVPPGQHSAETIAADLKRCRWLATWMDAKFQIGPVKFGLDALVSLIPVAGDTLSVLGGVYPIYLVHKHKLGWTPALKMIGVLTIEWFIGLPPWLGDAADIYFKANLVNADILEKAIATRT